MRSARRSAARPRAIAPAPETQTAPCGAACVEGEDSRYRQEQRGSLEAVALLFPRVGIVVVAVAPPEAGPVDRGELDHGQRLRALLDVRARGHGPGRAAVPCV